MTEDLILVARAEMLREFSYKRCKRAVEELDWIAIYLRQSTIKAIQIENERYARLNRFIRLNEEK